MLLHGNKANVAPTTHEPPCPLLALSVGWFLWLRLCGRCNLKPVFVLEVHEVAATDEVCVSLNICKTTTAFTVTERTGKSSLYRPNTNPDSFASMANPCPNTSSSAAACALALHPVYRRTSTPYMSSPAARHDIANCIRRPSSELIIPGSHTSRTGRSLQ